MHKVKRFIIAMLILGKFLNAATTEETYIEIRAKALKNDFYRVLYDEENDEIYIGVGSFIDFLRINSLKLDRRSYKIVGYVEEGNKLFQKKIPKEKSIREEDDIFIPLKDMKDIFELKEAEWSLDDFTLKVTPDFKLPYEYLVDAKIQRETLELLKKNQEESDAAEEEYYHIPNALITPGMLKLKYINSDIKKNEYSFGLDYGTQFLYGELELSQSVIPESKLNYGRLKYPNFLGGNSLIFGDAILETDSVFNIDRSIRGISLIKDEYVGVRGNNNQITIEGEALGANLIELYRNGILIDYVRNPVDTFRFLVPNISSSDSYTIKRYRNTEVETKEVYILGSNKILGKGEIDYLIQSGRSIYDEEMQYLTRYKYGITENLTLGIGAASLRNTDGDEYDVIEGTIGYRTSFRENPVIFTSTIIEDIKNDQINLKASLEQKLGRNDFFLEYEQYGSKTSEILNTERLYRVEWGRDFNRIYGTLGYLNESYKNNKNDSLYINFSYYASRNLTISAANQISRTKGQELLGNEPYINHSIQMNYSGIKDFYTILNGNVSYQQGNVIDRYISVEFTRNLSANSYFRNWDFSAEVGHSNLMGSFFSLNLAYIFDGVVYVEFPNIESDSDDGTRIGGRIEKTFYLGNPKLPINNSNVRDGWIKGTVFIDENNNGIYDKGEKVMENVKVMNSGSEAFTNAKGQYVIGDVTSGEYLHSLEIDKSTIDAMLTPSKKEIKFKGTPSSGHNLDIALTPVSIISGYISPKDHISDSQYNGVLSGTDVMLIKDGKEIMRTQTEMGGYYAFEDVIPGKYTVTIEYKGIRYSPKFDRKEFEIMVKSGKMGDYYEENNFILEKITIKD